MTTEANHIIKDAKLVLSHFNELVKKKCLISAHFGEQNAGFLTAIIAIDRKSQSLHLDCAPTETLDKQLLASRKVLFRTEVDGIKVSFGGKAIKKIKAGGDWVLSLPIPDSIFWMQRRHYYRVRIPFSHKGSYCRLTLNSPDHGNGEIVTFQLHDLSITGFSFLNSDSNWIENLRPEREFVDCSLHLNNGSQFAMAFVIKNNIQIPHNSLNTHDRIGCLFRGLASSSETSIQRYMQEIELQQKNIG